MRTHEISNSDNIIDSREIIARIEELDAEQQILNDDLAEAIGRYGPYRALAAMDMAADTPFEVARDYAMENFPHFASLFEGEPDYEPSPIKDDQAQDDLDAAQAALDDWESEFAEELATLQSLAEEGENSASDWRRGARLIRESYFVDYCRETVADLGYLPRDIPDYIEIDWEATANNLRADYSEVDFDGVTYLVR